MNDIVDKCGYPSFFTILGGLISGGMGFLLALYKRKRDPKDKFLTFISMIEIQIDTSNVFGFHQRTKDSVRDAIAGVRPFLDAEDSQRLLELWKEFDVLTEDRLYQPYQEQWDHECRAERIDGATPPPEQPSAVLKGYFYKFSNLAK